MTVDGNAFEETDDYFEAAECYKKACEMFVNRILVEGQDAEIAEIIGGIRRLPERGADSPATRVAA